MTKRNPHTLKKSINAEISEAQKMLQGARDFLRRDELAEARIACGLAHEATERAADTIEEREGLDA